LCLGTWDAREPSPPLLDWQLCTEKGILPITHSGVALHPEEDRQYWGLVQNLSLPVPLKRELHRVLTRAEQPAKTRSIYVGLPAYASYSKSAENLAVFLRSIDATNPFDCIIVIEVLKTDVRYPLDFVDGGLRAIGLEQTSTESFVGNNLQLHLYRRTR
jgi:hypothetical protein